VLNPEISVIVKADIFIEYFNQGRFHVHLDSSGIVTSMLLRLCSRAPLMMIE